MKKTDVKDAKPKEIAKADRQWYVIHTYSGYEHRVQTNLEHRVRSMDAQDKIYQVIIPTENEIEIKDGQKRTVAKKSGRALFFSRKGDIWWIKLPRIAPIRHYTTTIVCDNFR